MTPRDRELRAEDYDFADEHIAYREGEGRGYPSMLMDIEKWPLKGVRCPSRGFTVEVYAETRRSWRERAA